MRTLAAAVTLVVAAAAGCAGSGTKGAAPLLDQPPATYADALARIAAARDVTPAPAATLPTFTSPSGDVYCDLNLPACELASGGRVELLAGEPEAVRNGDTIVQPDAPELTYGTSITTRDTACVSERIGITCVARGARTGFFVGADRYLLITL